MQLKQWANDERRVVATVNVVQDGKPVAIEIDGKLKAAHEKGIMIRPKGRIDPEMAKMEDIEDIQLYDERPKPIEPKRMTHIMFGSIRQHLADRHGLSLLELNDKDFTENSAYDAHEADHAPSADPMSHFHEG